ncbi:amino acid ABC transporter permease [Paracoccus aminophilus]|uniref:ABC-type amino acid transport system, permease component n=1 Tax=Paracoccus aminophilus JCM 7686 TaxID=1367847 RepID=S5XTN2_PARAH|nr:amino acid ABC transporter permease [Paracoccus aminophilus]AGT10874.1 ABC-type amino acid transport system, permease component [Paracoccus aminophilus JCM 7686]
METLYQEFFNLEIMRKVLPMILAGLKQTAFLCVMLIPIGLISGIFSMLGATSERRWIRWPSIVFIDFFRAFPPLVLIIFVYSGIPFLGLQVPAMAAIAVAFLLNSASYYGEIYRAGMKSVPKGQREAARSTGLSAFQTFIYVTFPQAVRNVLPDLLSNTVELVKLTTLASVISVPELLHSADLARSLTYNTSPLILAAAIYLVVLWPVMRLVSRLQNRLS